MGDFKYNDIICMQYPNPEIEKDFPDRILREAQFAPFAALTGHDEAIAETARQTDRKIELDEYAKAEINAKLQYINDHIDDGQEITVTYFVPDERKSGGTYVTKTGVVRKLREYKRRLVFEDGAEIPIEEIFSIEDKRFLENE